MLVLQCRFRSVATLACVVLLPLALLAFPGCGAEDEEGGDDAGPTALGIVTTTLPDATAGLSYGTLIVATGGQSPYSWAITSGSLPSGLSLTGGSTAQTTVAGNTSAVGAYNFEITVADAASASAVSSFVLNVVYPPLNISTASLTDAVEGAPYARQIVAAGGSAAGYTWAVVSGTPPPGLSLTASGTPAANLTGTPTSAGSYIFTVEVTDSAAASDTQVLAVTVHPPLQITSGAPPNCMVGLNYNFPLTATGGFGTRTWDVPTGLLPPGLVIQTTGAITGQPNTAGTYNFTLRVTESGTGSSATLPCTVVSYPALTITTTSLADGLTTQAYSQSLNCTGGTGSGHSWTLLSGPLPNGISLAATGNPGSLAGTPTKAGVYPLSIRVTDSGGFQSTANLNLTVGAMIQTYAGNGQQYGPNQLWEPEAVVLDGASILYIADTRNSVVRRLDLSTGTLTLFAGNGTPGYSGDGGQATAATLGLPVGLALGTSGDLFICDHAYSVVRRVDSSTGVITTVAGNGTNGFSGDGGTATQAMLNSPTGIAVSGGDLYIADADNHRVRIVSAGVISTFAGDGNVGFSGDGGSATAASLDLPRDVTIDALGRVWLCDRNNHRLRMVSGGIITTVCGNGSQGMSGDGGQATSAEITAPEGITLGLDGHIYFSDTGNHRVRRVHTGTGVITTIAGIATSWSGYGYSGDGGPATSAEFAGPMRLSFNTAGDLFIPDYLNQVIRRIHGTTQVITTVPMGTAQIGDGGAATAAIVGGPFAIARDPQGNLLIGENYRIRRVDATSNVISTVAGNGIQAFSGDGGPASAAQFMLVSALAVDGQGNIYVADSYAHRIRRIDVTSGDISTIAGSGPVGYGQGSFAGDGGQAVSARLDDPRDIALDGAGMLYIADSGNHRIRRVNLTTGVITTFAGNGSAAFAGDNGQAASASLNRPEGVCLHPGGFLLIADSFNHRVRAVQLGTGVITTWAGTGTMGFGGDGGAATGAQFSSPRRVLSDASGLVYVADEANQRVRRFSGQGGTIRTVAGGGSSLGDGGSATSAQISGPQALLIGPGDVLYVVDRGHNRVRAVFGP